jgi:hypothetical protein
MRLSGERDAQDRLALQFDGQLARPPRVERDLADLQARGKLVDHVAGVDHGVVAVADPHAGPQIVRHHPRGARLGRGRG